MASNIPSHETLEKHLAEATAACGLDLESITGDHVVTSPIDGQTLATIRHHSPADLDHSVAEAKRAFLEWRRVPAPTRGRLIRRFSELLIEHKSHLGKIVSLEVGKTTSEALGEVQEMIDMCDFATGLSRQLYGRTIATERPGHRLAETWHPLGVVGVISAFNFPVAVWSWNAALALVCGDTVVWKPSHLAPITAAACNALLRHAASDVGAPEGLSQLVIGGEGIGAALAEHHDVALVSATGSTRMGRIVGPKTAERFGRSLLELGGNNAAIVAPSADLDLATQGIVFAATGTAGQRCTTMRRLIVHQSIIDPMLERLKKTYERLPIGSPLSSGTLVGPLIDEGAFDAYSRALRRAQSEGGYVVTGGGRRFTIEAPDAYYVEPAILRMPAQTPTVRSETFAPLLYVMTYQDIHEAIALNNDVTHGLSSSIFTNDQAEAEFFCSAEGSDCGIVNVNIGTSGAEIGGAFGGDKETGGGREAGSDAWKAYMRRATSTINYSGELTLAQGVEFRV